MIIVELLKIYCCLIYLIVFAKLYRIIFTPNYVMTIDNNRIEN